jgi:cell division protein FtsX
MVDRVAGATRPFILKPFTLSALLATIERVVPVTAAQ